MAGWPPLGMGDEFSPMSKNIVKIV